MTPPRRVVIAAFLMVLTGCASTPPLAPVSHPDERLHFNGFSALPPSGADWSWVGRKTQESNRLFATTFVKRDGWRSVVARAELADTRGQSYAPEELLTLMKAQPRFREAGRQRNLKIDFRIESTLGTPCVRFDGTAEDPEAPGAGGVVLDIDFHGFACVHPLTPGMVADISYSRRAPKGQSHVATPDEGERFLGSLLFTPVRR
jgi:hypothetical protein